MELNHLYHKIYSAIKQIKGQTNRADVNSIYKEIVITSSQSANNFEIESECYCKMTK